MSSVFSWKCSWQDQQWLSAWCICFSHVTWWLTFQHLMFGDYFHGHSAVNILALHDPRSNFSSLSMLFCLLMEMLRLSKVPFLALLPFYTDWEFIFNFAIPFLTWALTIPDSISTCSPGLLNTSPGMFTGASDLLCADMKSLSFSSTLFLLLYFTFWWMVQLCKWNHKSDVILESSSALIQYPVSGQIPSILPPHTVKSTSLFQPCCHYLNLDLPYFYHDQAVALCNLLPYNLPSYSPVNPLNCHQNYLKVQTWHGFSSLKSLSIW